MPRRNRTDRHAADDDRDLSSFRSGWRRTETRRGSEWNVQPVSGAGSEKRYVCPGCGGGIDPGVSHLVAWRADGVLGDAADLAGRRHWHEHCWRVGA